MRDIAEKPERLELPPLFAMSTRERCSVCRDGWTIYIYDNHYDEHLGEYSKPYRTTHMCTECLCKPHNASLFGNLMSRYDAVTWHLCN